jgi:hypothetical protein
MQDSEKHIENVKANKPAATKHQDFLSFEQSMRLNSLLG